MKNKLIVIGYLSIKRAYLNISKAEAVRRYMEDTCTTYNETIKLYTKFEFDDEFLTYDSYSLN